MRFGKLRTVLTNGSLRAGQASYSLNLGSLKENLISKRWNFR